MKRIVFTSLMTLICLFTVAQENPISRMTADEIFDKACDYYYGNNGETQNIEKAREYFLLAAGREHNKAKVALVDLHLVDCEEALRYLQEAASQQYTPAMNLLCWYFFDGGDNHTCFPIDYEKSFYWAETSASLGDVEGQYLLGANYLQGIGTEVDPIEGVRWFKKSAEGGFGLAMKYLAGFYRDGEYVQRNDKQALYWYKELAKQGDGEANYNIAWYYFYGGDGIDIDEEEAKRWCREGAIQLDNVDCCWLLTEILSGSKDEDEKNERLSLLEKAEAKGHLSATAELAKLNVEESIPYANPKWGIQTLKELSEIGDPRAMAIYGMYLYDGLYVQRNKSKGMNLTKQAAEMGDSFGFVINTIIEQLEHR